MAATQGSSRPFRQFAPEGAGNRKAYLLSDDDPDDPFVDRASLRDGETVARPDQPSMTDSLHSPLERCRIRGQPEQAGVGSCASARPRPTVCSPRREASGPPGQFDGDQPWLTIEAGTEREASSEDSLGGAQTDLGQRKRGGRRDGNQTGRSMVRLGRREELPISARGIPVRRLKFWLKDRQVLEAGVEGDFGDRQVTCEECLTGLLDPDVVTKSAGVAW